MAATAAGGFRRYFGTGKSLSFAREVEDFVRGPRVKDHPLRQVSKHVWMIFSPDGFPTPENQGMMCNITFINTAKGLVVVDSGASVQIGEMAIRRVQKAFNKRVVAVINTHTGWETTPLPPPTRTCQCMPTRERSGTSAAFRATCGEP
jgi:hypothetical protein